VCLRSDFASGSLLLGPYTNTARGVAHRLFDRSSRRDQRRLLQSATSRIQALGELFSRPSQQEVETTRSLLDTLLTEARLYRTTADYKALLDFVVRLRNFAPYNAMLLQVQKPGLTYAASAADWLKKFGRTPKEGAIRVLTECGMQPSNGWETRRRDENGRARWLNQSE
jgi:hypothetical protein